MASYTETQMEAITALANIKVSKDGKTTTAKLSTIIELLDVAGELKRYGDGDSTKTKRFCLGWRGKLDCTKVEVIYWAKAVLDGIAKPVVKGRAVPAKEAPVTIDALKEAAAQLEVCYKAYDNAMENRDADLTGLTEEQVNRLVELVDNTREDLLYAIKKHNKLELAYEEALRDYEKWTDEVAQEAPVAEAAAPTEEAVALAKSEYLAAKTAACEGLKEFHQAVAPVTSDAAEAKATAEHTEISILKEAKASADAAVKEAKAALAAAKAVAKEARSALAQARRDDRERKRLANVAKREAALEKRQKRQAAKEAKAAKEAAELSVFALSEECQDIRDELEEAIQKTKDAMEDAKLKDFALREGCRDAGDADELVEALMKADDNAAEALHNERLVFTSALRMHIDLNAAQRTLAAKTVAKTKEPVMEEAQLEKATI